MNVSTQNSTNAKTREDDAIAMSTAKQTAKQRVVPTSETGQEYHLNSGRKFGALQRHKCSVRDAPGRTRCSRLCVYLPGDDEHGASEVEGRVCCEEEDRDERRGEVDFAK